MAILKANEPIPERPVVIVLYGDPGARKTSVAHTAETPVDLDFDRGIARSYGRKDAVLPDNWEEILQLEKEGFFKQFKTVITDTAKAALDDFLVAYVIRQDYKLQKNKLQMYGAIGDEYKRFTNARREEGADNIIIAHAKKDEDTKRIIPDVTGQSSQLLQRIADQIGLVTFRNSQAVIIWNPSDFSIGKNTANLPDTIIPDKSDPSFKTFMSDIIAKVKKSMVEKSEEQRKALEQSDEYQSKISLAKNAFDINAILHPVQKLPKHLRDQLNKLIGEKAKELGLIFDKDAKPQQFKDPVKPAGSEVPGSGINEEIPAGQEQELNFS